MVGMPELTLVEKPRTWRVQSVDVLRGLTVALMILVNDPGDWGKMYAQLDHAEWNGWTLTDLVFPNFLFLVGCSLVFSMEARMSRGAGRKELALHLLRRSASVLLLGWFLALAPYFHFTRLRLYGVLPRIALVGFLAGLVCLFVRRVKPLVGISAVLLVGYWVVMRWAKVPGLGHPGVDFPFMDKDLNMAAWMDRGVTNFLQATVHTGRLYEKTRDPEGLLSTVPAVATALLGAAAGSWMLKKDGGRVHDRGVQSRCRNGLVLAGVLSFALGELWNIWFPINKRLWTSSYVLMAAGISLVMLGALYWWLDVERLQERSRVVRWMAWKWLVFGSNAIVAFTVSIVLVKTLLLIKVTDSWSGKSIALWNWCYRHGFARGNSTPFRSLLFAIVVVKICFIPNWLLWRKKIFIKL